MRLRYRLGALPVLILLLLALRLLLLPTLLLRVLILLALLLRLLLLLRPIFRRRRWGVCSAAPVALPGVRLVALLIALFGVLLGVLLVRGLVALSECHHAAGQQ